VHLCNVRRNAPGEPFLASFDVQITDDFLLRDMSLRKYPGGDIVLLPPYSKFGGRAAASMSPRLRADIRELALRRLGAVDACGQ
jgi:hypothetical protein